MKHSIAALLLVLPLCSMAQTPVQVQPMEGGVARAAAVEGTAFVTRVDGTRALLARGGRLLPGETVNTARNSSVRLRFNDGGETVVRPESSLLVQEYRFVQEAPAQDSAILRLIKGGLRALTGAIGKRGDVNAYQLRVSTATVGIRGTDFSVRLCKLDCGEPPATAQRNSTAPVAARAVQLVGESRVVRGDQAAVPMTQDKALYAGDIVETSAGAYAVLVFKDNTRATVNPSSRFAIRQYSDDTSAKAPTQSMWVQLLTGGLRFATGLIGKRNAANVRVSTPTATVGIRGTVFDLVCAPSASSDRAAAAELADMPCEQSLFVQTREGTVALAGTEGAELLVGTGQNGRVNAPGSVARPLAEQPEYFRNLTTPEPERVVVDMEKLFGTAAVPDKTDGVFVMVHEGRVNLAQGPGDITLDAGESAFAGPGGEPVRLQSTPAMLNFDPFLSTGMFNVNMCRP